MKEALNYTIFSTPSLIEDMTDNIGFGKEKRREGNLDILAGRDTFR